MIGAEGPGQGVGPEGHRDDGDHGDGGDDAGWTDDLDHDVWTDEELGFAADEPVIVPARWRPPRRRQQRRGLLPGGLRAELPWYTPDGWVSWPWDPGHDQPPDDARQDGWREQLPGWRPRRRGEVDRARTAQEESLRGLRRPGGQPLERFDGRPGGDRGTSPRVSVRLPTWLHEQLEDEARRRRTTPSAVVREAVGEHLGRAAP